MIQRLDDDLTPWQQAARELAQAREAHERALVVGARVRVLGNAECPTASICHADDVRLGTILYKHSPSMWPLLGGHFWAIQYDEPYPASLAPWDGALHCANELELLDREPPSDGPAGE